MSKPKCERCDSQPATLVVALRGVFKRTLVCRSCAECAELKGRPNRPIKRSDY